MRNSTLNILITGIGGPTPRSFARAIKEIGDYAEYNLIGTDIHPHALGHYQKSIFKKSYITPKSNEKNYWRVMEDIIDREEIDFAIILPEQEILEWSRRQKASKLPCVSLIPPFDTAVKIINKGVLTKMLESEGVVPLSLLIDKDNKHLKRDTEETFNYPYWIRSATGSSGLGSFKIESYDDLEKWLYINKEINNFIASEYLPGRNLACKMLYYKGELLRSACAERINYIMAKVAPSKITGNTSFGRLINDENVFNVSKKAIENVFSQTGDILHGFYTVDLKENEKGEPKVTEINLRHVAFTQCFAMGGANICEDTIRLLDKDETFDYDFKLYEFEEGLIFLRDVDERPIVMLEEDLLN